ncbi:hypothetical protein JQ597_25350 [Bradyrhizobium sp. AUGA SZCCT0177]|uniref:hypothetical protein n=1 Tax=Bradyrhizobium sp. AUGA SZCCT0177 TaxID=2807665 RepID=UPI001BAA39F1|nr:hypothetical protein [Bradyrhizobium sp. AUGA SZCCT0177]MBR1285381.1 hypothetical protein [Bradyrhizobium sp. AUGA SZCCT0177]
MSYRSPEEILASTTPQVQKLIDAILKIEKEYQQFRDLSRLRDKESELCERITRLLEQEIKP